MSGKHRKAGFWEKVRRLRFHVKAGQITLKEAIYLMSE